VIKAIIFDLDGTLVQTEALKAASYAGAAVELRPDTFSEEEVIEDSATGVKAALAAEMGCIAVTAEFTKRGFDESGLLDDSWIVDSPSDLQKVAERFIAEKASQTE
jgi:beta-phosphoglucomutase-like phosphatase (HAD superfamily)